MPALGMYPYSYCNIKVPIVRYSYESRKAFGYYRISRIKQGNCYFSLNAVYKENTVLLITFALFDFPSIFPFLQELHHYVEEYVNVYEADDDEEWRLVISEVTAFMEVSMKITDELR